MSVVKDLTSEKKNIIQESRLSYDNWDLIIKPKSGFLNIDFKEVWRYKDLITLLIKRDWDAAHKQTLLGPFWTIVQPLFMTVIFSLIFNKVGQISTNGVPPTLFYMCGLLPWNFFNAIFTKSSTTFLGNAGLFGKVYFPRLVVPFAQVASAAITFGINLLVFILFLAVAVFTGFVPHFNLLTILFPFLLIGVVLFGLGSGLIISSLTVKYRDLSFLVGFGLQLFMYATPIIFPLSVVPEKYRLLILLNPLSAIVEGFRLALLGVGDINILMLVYSFVSSLFLFILGIGLFNKTEKTFIDSI